VEIDWACAFCAEAVDDDPRAVDISLGFRDSHRTEQFYGAHFMCLKAAFTGMASAELFDPLVVD